LTDDTDLKSESLTTDHTDRRGLKTIDELAGERLRSKEVFVHLHPHPTFAPHPSFL
jgi:hypothetical protein